MVQGLPKRTGRGRTIAGAARTSGGPEVESLGAHPADAGDQRSVHSDRGTNELGPAPREAGRAHGSRSPSWEADPTNPSRSPTGPRLHGGPARTTDPVEVDGRPQPSPSVRSMLDRGWCRFRGC